MGALLALLMIGCSGSRRDADGTPINRDKEKLIEVLTLFVEAVQGDRFEKAFGYLTPTERSKMVDAAGDAPPLIRRRLKALRLSTLAQKPGVRLERGKLEGIFDWLPVIGAVPAGASKEPDSPVIQ